MDRQTLNTYLCAILTTLAEVDGAAESTLYIGIGCDFDRWQTVRQILVLGGLATVSANEVTITAKGRAIATAAMQHAKA